MRTREGMKVAKSDVVDETHRRGYLLVAAVVIPPELDRSATVLPGLVRPAGLT
jgi:hypothetical protein